MLTPLRGLGTYSSSSSSAEKALYEGCSFRVIHPSIHPLIHRSIHPSKEVGHSHLCICPLRDECPAFLLEGVHVGIVVPPHLSHGLIEPPEQHQVVPPYHHPGHECSAVQTTLDTDSIAREQQTPTYLCPDRALGTSPDVFNSTHMLVFKSSSQKSR